MIGERECDWCGRSFAPKREHAICCSVQCRKSRHRFGADCVPRRRGTHPLRLAYADPPYPGRAHYYEGHPDHAGEVDHAALIARLATFDGWALSTSNDALLSVGALASRLEPRRVHVGAWFRAARGHGHARRPRCAWEPVLYCGGRQLIEVATTDALIWPARPRLSDRRRVVGAKPARFLWWLFDLLGALPGDTLDDLFPGSGGVGRAWSVYESRAAGARRVASRRASRRVEQLGGTRRAGGRDARPTGTDEPCRRTLPLPFESGSRGSGAQPRTSGAAAPRSSGR